MRPVRIPAPMLRQEHAVSVSSPLRTCTSQTIGSETLGKVTSRHGEADSLDELAHEVKCGHDGTQRLGLSLTSQRRMFAGWREQANAGAACFRGPQ